MTGTLRVVVAEDMHLVRGALVALLRLEPDIEVAHEVATGDQVIPTVDRARPDVLVLDVDLPGVDGLTIARQLHERALRSTTAADPRVLVLTALGRPGMLRRAIAAEVDGFLPKDASPDRLADAIRGVAAGRRVIDSDLAVAAFQLGDCPLTHRELDVLGKAADGAEMDEIAAALYLSPGTVRNYLTSAVTKLGARNRLDAVRIATNAGWI